MRKNPRKKPETPLENRWKSNGFRAYNPSMSKKETWFRRPGPESLRQAIDWVAFAGTFALLFNVLHPSGIELKVRPSYEKAPATQAAPPPAQGTASYDGWASPEKATASNGSQTARPKVTTPTTLAEWQALFPHISLVGAQAAYADKNTVFIDSRKPEDYAEGHITGALHFYADEYEDYVPKVMPLLSRDMTYVIYCNGTTCDLSHHLALKLSEQGYKNLKVFFNGWSQWKKAGLPTRAGDQP
jgi:rhodanese-related sulfurtransferase